MRHPFVLACLFVAIVAIGASGLSALSWATNEGCQDWPGTRDADVSLQVVPFGIVCTYEADATGPAEVVVRAAGIPAFAAWLACLAVLVGYGIRRREKPAARGVVSGILLLGVFGLLATVVEFVGALAVTVVFGPVLVAVIDAWLASSRATAVVATALMVPFAIVAAWFVPGLYGWEEAAAVVALAAAAGATALGSRATGPLWPRPFDPV